MRRSVQYKPQEAYDAFTFNYILLKGKLLAIVGRWFLSLAEFLINFSSKEEGRRREKKVSHEQAISSQPVLDNLHK